MSGQLRLLIKKQTREPEQEPGYAEYHRSHQPILNLALTQALMHVCTVLKQFQALNFAFRDQHSFSANERGNKYLSLVLSALMKLGSTILLPCLLIMCELNFISNQADTVNVWNLLQPSLTLQQLTVYFDEVKVLCRLWVVSLCYKKSKNGTKTYFSDKFQLCPSSPLIKHQKNGKRLPANNLDSKFLCLHHQLTWDVSCLSS